MRVLRALIVFLKAYITQFVMNLPSDNISSRIRYLWLRRSLAPGSGRFTSFSGLWIPEPARVLIKEGVSISRGVILDGTGGEIEIGKNSLIGPYSVLRAADHGFSDSTKPIKSQIHSGGKIIVEDDCWIASHVVITRNVRISRGSVVGAQSVVTRDIPPYSVAFGVPARVVRSRREDKKAKA